MKNNDVKLTNRDLQAIERRSQLLESAKELFAANGYHATTTRQITKNIGMADGLIYHYFPEGKKQILDIIIKEFVDDRWIQLEKDISEVTCDISLQEILFRLGNIIFKYIGNDKNILVILLREQNILSEEYTNTFNNHIKKVIYKTELILKEKAEKNEIKAFDFFMMANQFWSAIYTYILQNTLFGEKNLYSVSKEVYLEQIINYTQMTWKK
ncbi:TetR/AcrR family transcriptional regulator [Clostridium sp. BL-8]|uniref:TetR/AcrR family transcriptional regulator n=1 Tax=Clostridium sp. BL-8 TaxID=349938 RepID=UPI00098CB942|nr:TetR/AcrR family transcriptional regulator [Clostridium sp. BL-8]OOM71021.1 HTH-type transcriptional repressor KstR2 [Clostridium sp. BL-8]